MESDIIEIRCHGISEQMKKIIIFLNVKNYGEKILAFDKAGF